MSRLKNRIIVTSLLASIALVSTQTVGIGNIQTNVPWKAGHASGFSSFYCCYSKCTNTFIIF